MDKQEKYLNAILRTLIKIKLIEQYKIGHRNNLEDFNEMVDDEINDLLSD